MGIIKSIHNAILNGIKVFSEAAHGDFKEPSPCVRSMWEELNSSESGQIIDRRNLRADRIKVANDVACAMQNYKSEAK